MRGDQLSLVEGPDAERRPAKRMCGCPCKKSIDHLALSAKYINPAHGQRAYRLRVKAEMERVGLPPLPSLRAAGVSRPTTHPNGETENDRKRPLSRKPSGAQVSYFKLVSDIPDEPMSKEEVERWITSKLSARQREQLNQRSERKAAA
jgi:hypothetical protein